MKRPPWLTALAVGIVIAGIIAFLRDAIWPSAGSSWLRPVADLSLVATLVAVLFYVYYTYVLASDSATLSASLWLEPDPNDGFHFLVKIQSYSKQSLQCWCDLNATVFGAPVALGSFYSGEKPFDVQPFSTVQGHFHIGQLLERKGLTINDARTRAGGPGNKDALYMNIDFWYPPVGSPGRTVRNPRQPYYVDLVRSVHVLDF